MWGRSRSSRQKGKRSVWTAPELILWSHLAPTDPQHRWRHHDRAVFGTPDFVRRDLRLAVFVDGCYWHGCPDCDLSFSKAQATRNRDAEVNLVLSRQRWTVVRVWGHEVLRDEGYGAQAVAKTVACLAADLEAGQHPTTPQKS